MKDADRGFASPGGVDGPQNEVVIVDQRRDVVIPARADRVPAVVPEVVYDEIEGVGEQRPERIVQVDREPVGVAQDQPGTRWVAVPTHRRDGVVVETNVNRGKRFG